MINKELLEQLMGRIKIFFISLILVFLVVSLQYLGLHVPNMLPYVSAKLQSMFQPLPTPPLNTQAVNTQKGGE